MKWMKLTGGCLWGGTCETANRHATDSLYSLEHYHLVSIVTGVFSMIYNLDHDQLEPRIQAHIYAGLGDTTWKEVFEFQTEWKQKHPGYPDVDYNPRADIYAVVGSGVFGVKLAQIDSKEHAVRQRSKPAVLGMSYGLTEYGLSWRIGTSVEEAKTIINKVFENCPGMKAYYALTRDEIAENEKVTTMFGLEIKLPWKHRRGQDRKWAFKRVFRRGVNAKIQGPGSDITLSGITDFEEATFGLDTLRVFPSQAYACMIVAEVHDSAVYDAPTNKLIADLQNHMENPSILYDYNIELEVPLVVDVSYGKTWS